MSHGGGKFGTMELSMGPALWGPLNRHESPGQPKDRKLAAAKR